MVLILIMIFIATANVVGCVLIKKRGIQIFLGIAAWSWVLIALASGLLLYNINYKTTDIDVSESPDGAYELHFQQIGEPDWPFGSTHARLVLESNGKTVTTCSFDIANDGKTLVLKTGKLYGAATTHQPPYSAKSKATIAITSDWMGKLKSSS